MRTSPQHGRLGSQETCPSRVSLAPRVREPERPLTRVVPLLLLVSLAAPVRADENEFTATVRATRPNADGTARTDVDVARYRGSWRHAGELAATAPGALALDFGGVLATTTVSLRGGASDQVAVLLDGVPLGSPAGGGLDLARVPAALLQGLDVRRGSDARLGAAAMGGALVLEPVRENRAMLSGGSLGTFGASVALTRDIDRPDARWNILGALDARRSTGDFDYARDPTPEIAGNDDPIALTRTNNDALLGAALVRARRVSETGTLSLVVFGTVSDRGLPGPIYTPTPTARQREWSALAQLSWETQRATLPIAVRSGWLDNSTGEQDTDGAQTFVDVSTHPTLRFSLGTTKLAIDALAGLEMFHGAFHGDRSRLRGGAGAEWSIERKRATGSVALRGDVWGNAVAVVPRIGGSLALARGLSLFGNAGGGFRPPSFGELYFASGPVLPNPDLRPERAWTADLGARFDRTLGTTNVGASAAAFASLSRDTIVYELFSGTRAKPFNVAGARTLGLEAETHVTPGFAPQLALAATLTLLDARSLVDGHNDADKLLPYRPAIRTTGSARWSGERLRGSVEAAFTGESWANRANTRHVPGFVDLRGGAGVRVHGPFWLSAEIRNALDVRDRVCLEGYPLPGRVGLLHLSWEPGDEKTP